MMSRTIVNQIVTYLNTLLNKKFLNFMAIYKGLVLF